jgi:membrane protein DedA with SNARE-associated domain
MLGTTLMPVLFAIGGYAGSGNGESNISPLASCVLVLLIVAAFVFVWFKNRK